MSRYESNPSQDVRIEISGWETDDVLDLCRNELGVNTSYLEDWKRRGDFGMETKVRHVKAAYKKDARVFFTMNIDRLPDEYRDALNTGRIPHLKAKDMYQLIDSFEGKDWGEVTAKYLNIEISEQDENCATRHLRKEQIITLLSRWVNGRGSPEEVALHELQEHKEACEIRTKRRTF